jgi:hypothetical protein
MAASEQAVLKATQTNTKKISIWEKIKIKKKRCSSSLGAAAWVPENE